MGSTGLENTSDLLQQIVDKLDELQARFGSASSSALPTFPAGTKFYTSDGRGCLSAIRAPVISVPLEKSHFDNDPVKRTEEISGQINFLTEQEKREIMKLLLKK